jgi:SynChlorMet cassette radical SAM/SPASM protein ScmE
VKVQNRSEAEKQIRVMRTPRQIDLDLTARCNLRCTYCYFFDNPEVEYQDLPTEEWLHFFEECGQLGIMELTLAGGEPFMRKDLRALIDGVVANRMRFSMLSNGALINDEIAGFIASTGRCNSIQISIDGSCPEVHDTCRGKGSFEKAVGGIRTLQRHGIRVTVRMTIHRHNVSDLADTARFLLEDLGLPGFSTNSAGYLGTCRVNANDVMLTTEERQAAMEELLRLNLKYNGRISATAGPLANGRKWARMEKARREGAPPFPGHGYLTGCGCPSNKIAVRADGTVVPCNMLTHMELGRINRDALIDLWQKNQELNTLRERRLIPLSDFEFCSGCPYINYCTGNCPALSYTLTGEVDHPSPDACLRRFLRDGGVIPEGIFAESEGKINLEVIQ